MVKLAFSAAYHLRADIIEREKVYTEPILVNGSNCQSWILRHFFDEVLCFECSCVEFYSSFHKFHFRRKYTKYFWCAQAFGQEYRLRSNDF